VAGDLYIAGNGDTVMRFSGNRADYIVEGIGNALDPNKLIVISGLPVGTVPNNSIPVVEGVYAYVGGEGAVHYGDGRELVGDTWNNIKDVGGDIIDTITFRD
jgi:hypothetical protein